jgi:hypothetical protein
MEEFLPERNYISVRYFLHQEYTVLDILIIAPSIDK